MKRLLAYLQLLRLPNVFTAMSDIFMGFLIARGSLDPWYQFLSLLVASSSIYLAGMTLNDWFDIEVDRQERPQRPLPSGRVPRWHALAAGIGLMIVGLGLAACVGATSRNVAVILVAAVWAYDGLLKNTLLGPACMGLCRALNVLLGLSTTPAAIWLFDLAQAPAWRFGTTVAAGLGLYVMGVTRFARREASSVPRADLLSSTTGFNLGLLLIAMVPAFASSIRGPLLGPDSPYWLTMDLQPDAHAWWIRYGTAATIWVSVLLTTNLMVWRAVDSGTPGAIQQAVKTCILAIIAVDATVVAFVNGPLWAVAILALLVPTLWLGRWVYST